MCACTSPCAPGVAAAGAAERPLARPLRSQVYIRIRDDEWNVYRRYAEFRALHHGLQRKFAQVRAFTFPPKKALGNKVGPAALGPPAQGSGSGWGPSELCA